MMIRRIALLMVSSLLTLDALALGNGCSSDDGQGGDTPLLDCDDGGCGGGTGHTGAASGGGSSGTSGAGTGSGSGSTGTGTGDDGGGTTGTGGGGISDGGGSGNILPTDSGSTGSLPTNTE